MADVTYYGFGPSTFQTNPTVVSYGVTGATAASAAAVNFDGIPKLYPTGNLSTQVEWPTMVPSMDTLVQLFPSQMAPLPYSANPDVVLLSVAPTGTFGIATMSVYTPGKPANMVALNSVNGANGLVGRAVTFLGATGGSTVLTGKTGTIYAHSDTIIGITPTFGLNTNATSSDLLAIDISRPARLGGGTPTIEVILS